MASIKLDFPEPLGPMIHVKDEGPKSITWRMRESVRVHRVLFKDARTCSPRYDLKSHSSSRLRGILETIDESHEAIEEARVEL